MLKALDEAAAARPDERRGTLLGSRCRQCWRRSRPAPSIPPRSRSPRRVACAAAAKPCATSTSSPVPPTPEALIAHFVELPVGRRGRRPRRHEGDRPLEPGSPLRPSGRAARVLREPPAALHRLEAPQRRAPRGGRPARLLGLGVRRQGRRDGRGAHDTQEEADLYELLGYAVHPAGAARELRRARGGAGGDAARARRGCATSAATSTRTRPGRPTGRRPRRRWPLAARARGYALPRRHRPFALPARGTDGGAGGRARRAEREARARSAC